jgi:SAM-dependent methyltransferase
MGSYDEIPGFGVLYDSVPLYAARKDAGFYVAQAVGSGGHVLELGCGTGRILIPIAREGVRIAGLDGSSEMLARCRSKLRDEPAAVRERVLLHEADVRSFDLDAQFAMIIAPFRVMQHLVTIDEQIECLDSVRRHLAPGGRLVFDVFNPHFHRMVAVDGSEQEDTPEQSLPDGRVFRRTARITRVRWVEQVNDVELVYYVALGKGVVPDRYVHGFPMRWYLRTELEHLLARAGFRVASIQGDFEGGALGDGSPEIVVIAERSS